MTALGEFTERQEHRLHLPGRRDPEPIVELYDVEILHGELGIPHREGVHVIRDEGVGLVLCIVRMLSRQCQRGRVHCVGKLALVSKVARHIDSPAHDEQKGNRSCAEEDEDVASLIPSKTPKNLANKIVHCGPYPERTPQISAQDR